MKVLYRLLSWYDAYWRSRHGVEKFDDLLSFSFQKYSGDRREMNDGTWLEPGDCLAIIHFNRECFTNSSNNLRHNTHNALRFRRLILSSFKQLATEMDEKKFMNVKAFHGVSWIPPHGEKLGFVIERVPDSALNFIRKIYLTVLLKTFFPHLPVRKNNPIEPYAYWLTRHSLLKNFSAGDIS